MNYMSKIEEELFSDPMSDGLRKEKNQRIILEESGDFHLSDNKKNLLKCVTRTTTSLNLQL